MRHSKFLCSLTSLVICATHHAQDVWAAAPNIVFVLADDLGYGDVESFGLDRCQIDTPHFDRLVREGMRYTSAYSIASV